MHLLSILRVSFHLGDFYTTVCEFVHEKRLIVTQSEVVCLNSQYVLVLCLEVFAHKVEVSGLFSCAPFLGVSAIIRARS